MTSLVPLAGWLFLLVHVLGLSSAWLTRVSIGTVLQGWGQTVFFGSLVASGATTFYAVLLSSGWWLFSAAGLAAMILMAVLDFGRAR